MQEDGDPTEETTLPPFESVMQLTAAHLPPKQQGAVTVDGEAEVEMRGESEAGHKLKDGKGTLADGSTWERISGEEFGDNGYWCRCVRYSTILHEPHINAIASLPGRQASRPARTTSFHIDLVTSTETPSQILLHAAAHPSGAQQPSCGHMPSCHPRGRLSSAAIELSV